MRRRAFLALLAGAGALSAGGCSTISAPRSDRGTGVMASYVAPFDQMWATLPSVLQDLGLKVTSSNMQEGILQVEPAGSSTFSWGDSATIFVERLGTKGYTRVEVAIKSTLGVNLLGGDMPKQVHDRIALHFRRF
jgi:hypothetical protein